MYGSIPEQYCIGSTTSKSVCNCINWGGSDNNYHHSNIQASKMIFNIPIEAKELMYSHDTLALVLTKLEG